MKIIYFMGKIISKNGVNRKIKVKAKNLNSLLLLHKYEINGKNKAAERRNMVPMQRLSFKNYDRK